MATPPRRPSPSRPNQPGYGDAIAQEALRQARVRLFRRVPLLYELSNVYTRLRSGSYASPRYVVGAVVSLLVVAGGALVSCLGVVGALLASLAGR